MLTTDLVRTRRRAGRIEAIALSPAERDRLEPVANAFARIAATHVGQSRAHFDAALDAVPQRATDYKRVKGLRKLLLDRCRFDTPAEVDATELRSRVFELAARKRRELGDGEAFDREATLAAVAAELGVSVAHVEEGLFADLRDNQRLVEVEPIGGAGLLAAYDLAQNQALLLRATRVVVTLRCRDPGTYRLLFAKLKFRRLLYTLERHADGAYRIEIDGPYSLFRAVTKYGLQLALMLPVFAQADEWTLEAEVNWGREAQAYQLRLSGNGSRSPEPLRLRDEVERLRTSFAALDGPWQVAVADQILDLPGFGVCVPDLVFHHVDGRRVYLEVLGFWSREAVWRRVELVEAGLAESILFAVSERLRVSEDVLDVNLPGQLYVYKGVMSAAAVAERLDRDPRGQDSSRSR